jgi:small subunit ribosomal protein S9
MTKGEVIIAVGRRKTGVASVFLTKGKGKILVNKTPINEHFTSEKDKIKWMKPFFVAGISNPEQSFSADVKLSGSGVSGQVGALALGFSKALAIVMPEIRSSLRKQGLLTRDSRMVERKKPYLRKARKAPQYSKR